MSHTHLPHVRASQLIVVATFFATLLTGLAPLTVRAQNASVHPVAPPVATAARRTGPISIDGRLDEAAWANATPITAFRQAQPNEGAPASLPTEVRILFDDEALYVGARMTDPTGRAGIRAPLARRDQLLAANGNNGSFNSLTTDKIAIVLDPYHNHLDEAWFEINPAGVRGESFSGDDSWDPVWEGASHIDANGWTAEMRIPYSQLRFSRDSIQTWGMQLWRYADRLNERDMWSFWRRNESGGAPFFGHLKGLVIVDRPRQLELLPYVVSKGTFKYSPPGDPYHSSHDVGINAGADLKYLLTSNLTLDATFNPDFGQVEVDPASLNLSAFETYYDEKRPFFVAGRSAFNFGGASCMFCSNFSSLDLFYSRRIGRPPQLAGYVEQRAGDTGFVDTPDRATILGAAKITGRTNAGYSIGILDAVANSETSRYVAAPGTPELSQVVEPLTNYFVGRVKKELRQGATTIGVALTSTIRRLDGDSVLTDRLHDNATALGVDWSHSWDRRVYRWRGSIVASGVSGSPEAITATEESSAHYFQRPDRRVGSDGLFGVRYDTTATSLKGYGFYTRLAKENGNWLWETMQNWRSPGFEVNDLSYLDRADYKSMNANVARQWTTPGRNYRSIVALAGAQQAFDYDGIRTDEDAHAYYSMEFPNYWNLRAFSIYRPVTEDDRLTRGGPEVKRSGYTFGHFQVSTDARQRAVFDVTVEGSRGVSAPTHMVYVSPGIALKPAASVFIQLSPGYSADEDAAQYVTSVRDPAATAFNGTRYVFAFIRTRTVSFDTRVNWTLEPDLTLQLYAQPFFASGAYSGFREFEAPRTLRKLEYGRDIGSITPTAGGYAIDPGNGGLPFTISNPNFSYGSLRGTAVLRWEYRPGSTMFFVWTQQRDGTRPDGDYRFSRDYAQLFSDRPDNVFLIKATWWIGR